MYTPKLGGFRINSNTHIDARFEVDTYSALANIPYKIRGLRTYVVDEDKTYRYNGSTWNLLKDSEIRFTTTYTKRLAGKTTVKDLADGFDALSIDTESPTIATVTVGGVSAGTTFPTGTSFETILKNILSPYVAGSITNFTVYTDSLDYNNSTVYYGESSSSRNHEVGQVSNLHNLNIYYSHGTNSDDPTTASIIVGGTDITNSPNYAWSKNNTSNIWTLSRPDSQALTNTLGGSIVLQTNVYFNTTYLKSSAITYTWQHRYYLGASILQNITSGNIDVLINDLFSNSSLRSSKNGNYTCPSLCNDTSYYTYIVIPISQGMPSNIIQNGAEPVLGAFTSLGTFNVINKYNVTVPSYVLKSNSTGAFAANTTLTIS